MLTFDKNKCVFVNLEIFGILQKKLTKNLQCELIKYFVPMQNVYRRTYESVQYIASPQDPKVLNNKEELVLS